MLDGLGGKPGEKSGPILVPAMRDTRAVRFRACQSQKILSSQVWWR